MKKFFIQYAQQYEDICRKVKKSARYGKERWIYDEYEQADKSFNMRNTKQAYGLIKMLKRDFVPRLSTILNEESALLLSEDEIRQRFRQYCSILYKDPGRRDKMVKELDAIILPDNEDAQDMLYSEVQAAIGS